MILQLGLVVLGLALAWALGIGLTDHFELTLNAATWALAATLPLILLLLLFRHAHWSWARELTQIIQELLSVLFHRAPAGTVLLVSLLAGIGEELLFRGVLQTLFTHSLGTVMAIALTSLLFGLAHAITPAYFVAATLISIYLGWLYAVTGNLLVPMLVHALYDWFAIRYYLRQQPGA